MRIPLSNWNKNHQAEFIAYLSKWTLLVKDILFEWIIWRVFRMPGAQGLGSQRQEWVDVSCVWLWRRDCCWLSGIQKCVRGVSPCLTSWLAEAKSCLRLVDLQKWVHSFFYWNIFWSVSFIVSWSGSQSNSSLVVRNYWKPVFRNPLTKSILRIYKAFFGGNVLCFFVVFAIILLLLTTWFK